MNLGFGIIDDQGENGGMVMLYDFNPNELNMHPNEESYIRGNDRHKYINEK